MNPTCSQIITNDELFNYRNIRLDSMNNTQVIFTIPYSISNESILNQTIFITDIKHQQLIKPLVYICTNQSSFIINYSTIYKISVVAPVLLRLDSTTDAINPEIINENDFILSPIEENVLAANNDHNLMNIKELRKRSRI